LIIAQSLGLKPVIEEVNPVDKLVSKKHTIVLDVYAQHHKMRKFDRMNRHEPPLTEIAAPILI
jgi:hypothetical protein